MADELTMAALVTNAGLAHRLATALHMKVNDPTDIRAALSLKPWLSGMGTDTTKTTMIADNFTFANRTSEVAGGAANSAIGDASANVTPTRRLLQFQESTLWRMCAPAGGITPEAVAGVIDTATGRTITSLACDLFNGFTGNTAVGSDAVDMSFELLEDAEFALSEALATGPLYAVLKPKAFNEFRRSLRTAGGAVQYMPATAAAATASGVGEHGSWGPFKLYSVNEVNDDSGATYFENAVFAGGAIQYQFIPGAQIAAAIPSTVERVVAADHVITLDYSQANGLVTMLGEMFLGVSELEDARGIEVRSKKA